MKCYLIRHGITQDNIDLKFSGCQTDTPLIQKGIEQLDAVRDVPQNSILYVSFKEMDFGIFEAKNHLMLNGDPDYQAWLDSGGEARIPGGESIEMFAGRTYAAFEKAIADAAGRGIGTVYIVAHGGTIMAVMSTLTGEDYFGFNVPNGMGYVIELEADDAGNITSAGSYDRFCGGLRDGYRDWRPPQYTPSDQVDR